MLDFEAVEERVCELAALVSQTLGECHDHWAGLISSARRLKGEERLFYLLLVTHFDSRDSAEALYSTLTWNDVRQDKAMGIRQAAREVFREPRRIGDHRRHFMAMPPARRVSYTVEVIESYQQVMERYGSQAKFFETEGAPQFASLYERMREIEHFHTRLPRFDHLERLARTHNFYVVPDRFFADDNATGPLDGLTYLMFGVRYRKNRDTLRPYLLGDFPAQWNASVGIRCRVPARPQFRDIVRSLEEWTIDHIRGKLLPEKRRDPAYVFDLESCLCNWQKWK